MSENKTDQNLHQQTITRQRVLNRLWEIANLGPEQTRGSITGQVKALSMIVSIEGLIPNPRAASAEKPAPSAGKAQIYQAAWLRKRNAEAVQAEPASEETDPSQQTVTSAEAASSPDTSLIPSGLRNPFTRRR
jgi:hypothetical protein